MIDRMIVVLTLIGLVGIGFGCQTGAPASAPTGQSGAPPTDRRVLTTMASGNPEFSYELSIGKCADQTCPVEVRLMAQQKVLDTARLEWSASTDQVEEAVLDSSSSAGDPLEASPPWSRLDHRRR